MPTDILAYIGAAAMVVLAFLAYRYWRSTAAYAHRVRESHARQVRDSYRATTGQPPLGSAPSEEVKQGSGADLPEARDDPAEHDSEQHEAADETIEVNGESDEPEPTELGNIDTENVDPDQTPNPAFRLIEDLEPRQTIVRATSQKSISDLLKELDEELATLPSGIELMNLPLLERRRVADRREDLTNDRARLLEQRKKGNHRRSQNHRRSGPAQ